MTSPDSRTQSILAAECGNVTTTAMLIEMVEGHYHLKAIASAPSTHNAPWRDLTVGIQQATQRLEQFTGQTILAPGGWPIVPRNFNRQGVDAFLLVSSAGPPLNLSLIGLTHNLTMTSARRAATGTYTLISNEVAMDGPLPNGQRSTEARMQAVRQHLPEAILLVGGADGGAERPILDMANIVALAVQVTPDSAKPHILFAGNIETQTQVAAVLQDVAAVHLIENVRPTLDVENLAPLQGALENLYRQVKMGRLAGAEKVHKWTTIPLLPSSHAFDKTIRYMGQQHGMSVAGIDLGSQATVIATETRTRHHTLTVCTNAGMGHSLAMLLKLVPIEQFHRWLPFPLEPAELYNRLLNKSLHPTTLPTHHEDLHLEYAIAREALRLTAAQAYTGWPETNTPDRWPVQWDLLLGRGRTLTRNPDLGHTALLMLDGLEPWGVTKLTLDINGVTAILGALAAVEPVAAVEILAQPGTFLDLGTVVAPIGHGAKGKTALNVKMIEQGEVATEVEVLYGSIQTIPLAAGQKATLEMRPSRHFDIGLGQPGRGAVAEVEGGLLGIIVDARGRPLQLLERDEARREQLKEWLAALRQK